jgi:hypothetical protein
MARPLGGGRARARARVGADGRVEDLLFEAAQLDVHHHEGPVELLQPGQRDRLRDRLPGDDGREVLGALAVLAAAPLRVHGGAAAEAALDGQVGAAVAVRAEAVERPGPGAARGVVEEAASVVVQGAARVHAHGGGAVHGRVADDVVDHAGELQLRLVEAALGAPGHPLPAALAVDVRAGGLVDRRVRLGEQAVAHRADQLVGRRHHGVDDRLAAQGLRRGRGLAVGHRDAGRLLDVVRDRLDREPQLPVAHLHALEARAGASIAEHRVPALPRAASWCA